MKMSLLFVSFILVMSTANATPFNEVADDTGCNIFVVKAKNIAAERGNFLSARIAVKKSYVGENSRVRIQGYDNVSNSRFEIQGDYFIYIFDYFAPGIEDQNQTFKIEAYVDHVIVRLYDGNEKVLLTKDNNWNFQSTRCQL